jgi:ABC-type uncharacterized transport system permease subunit
VLAVHAAVLALRTVHLGHPPMASAQEMLSVVALAMAAVYAVVELAGRDRRTGVFVLALAFLFQYTSTVFVAAASGAPMADAAGAPALWSRLHVLPALVAYTAFAFAAIYGLLYLVAQRGLKGRRFGVFFDRLPPLDLLGRMSWHALLVGFAFMTVTIATGPLMFGSDPAAREAAMGSTKIIIKMVTGGVAWLIYAAAILGRLVGRWSPERVSAIAVAGYAVVVALLVASALLS